MVVNMTDQEHRDLDVLLATLPQLPNEAKAYLKGYAQAMADQNKEKEERPACWAGRTPSQGRNKRNARNET